MIFAAPHAILKARPRALKNSQQNRISVISSSMIVPSFFLFPTVSISKPGRKHVDEV